MTDLGLLPIQFVTVLLIFMRVLGMFTAAPIFGHAHVPPQVKIGLALTISLALLSVVPQPPAILAENVWLLAAAAVKEAAVGIILGFVATMVFMAIQLAGEAADIQIGFGLANIADPLLGTQTSLLGQFQFIVATLLFLIVNGHHLLLAALVRSFSLVPLDAFALHGILSARILDILAQLFLIGLSIGAPVMLAVFLTDLALGLLGRTVPQMNLLLVGFPIKILVGLGMLLISLPFFLTACRGLFDGMYRDLLTILRAM